VAPTGPVEQFPSTHQLTRYSCLLVSVSFVQLYVITDAGDVPESVVKVMETGSQELLMFSRVDALCDPTLGVVSHTVVSDFHPGLSAVVMPRLQSLQQLAVTPVSQSDLADIFAQMVEVRNVTL
jgi:hypothetical protein